MSTPWWKSATAYQIWPTSYKDSTGSGTGDLRGITSTLPHLRSLGIDLLWLSPMYASPQVDMGYDISSYESVDPRFGSSDDMETLIQQVHHLGMRIILDLVVNHTSDQHRWFLESRKARTGPYADWYIWKDPKYDDQGRRQEPNNWRAIFGGSAWEYVPERDQYYLHLFVPEQPDLNWENLETRQGVYDSAVRFWLDKGVDGFRVDTVNLYSKDTKYPDAPVTRPGERWQPAGQYYVNGPRMHEWLKEMHEMVLSKYGDEVVMVGELPGTDAGEVLRYVSAKEKELSMVFDFDAVSLGGRHTAEIKKCQVWRHRLPEFKAAMAKTQDLVTNNRDAWTTVFLENHDQGRSLSRFATDEPRYREKAAKMLAMLLCTLSGTLFIYQGQEIGMVNVPEEWGKEELRDVDALNACEEARVRYDGNEIMMGKTLRGLQKVGRDNARTPVQWSGEEHAGFTSGKPWIRVHDNYKEVNVAEQLERASSLLNFWKEMLKIRKRYAEFCIMGDFEMWEINETETFTYVKSLAGQKGKTGEKLLVVLNFSDGEEHLDVPTSVRGREMELVVTNAEKGQAGKQVLEPWEGRVYLVR